MISDKNTTIQDIKDLVAAFVKEREWEQFHSPKNLSMSIAIEAAELMEIFQWSDGCLDDKKIEKVREELADVVIYCLCMANVTGIDLATAIKSKVAANALKYPVEKYKGRYK
ncbi:nucleotide pyrophosphohydrolase [Pelotomaculum isophthalicicum JI]|uniref:Nucleotide pyrophosphohydrolase n=1 Tax=Pelotomaculum isophthalicicum JI TaxID=947010 RepID=A0A9X4H6U0_9FIRM|nr:nucleotide pyrophosphohydrolase [Pelotomaculum isophthalicicum]MDF9408729.1 nucleotide pyrophosphohydrolase [Pelotomaculum isophthalicicum JI]